ncbi:MAG: glycosyltransferase [Prevotella sp.]
MKIVELPSFFTPYGGEFCLEQSRALAALGHDVTILANVQLSIKKSLKCYIFNDTTRKAEYIDGVRIIRNEMRGMPLAVHYNFRQWVKTVEKMFAEYVKKYGKPDIIHAHCAKWAGYAALLISKEYGIPYVVTEHLSSMIYRIEFGENPQGAWQLPLLKKAYKEAERVVLVSKELADDNAPLFGTDYKWLEISNLIDTDFFSYCKREPLTGRPFRFCCIALFIPRKGYDVLFKAFDSFASKHPNSELCIAGRNTDGNECQRLINLMSNSSKVKTFGEISKKDVRDLLYRCDSLVLATRNEAQGLVLLEAMSTGIPVIATDRVPMNVRIDGGCHIVPVDDVQSMNNAMEQIYLNSDIDGKALSDKISSMVSPTIIGKKLDHLFTKIVEGISPA